MDSIYLLLILLLLRPSEGDSMYSKSQKKFPLRFSDIFSQTVGNFWSKFYVPIIRSYLR